MAKATYHTNRMKTYKRLAIDIKKDLYRLFRASKFRKEAATDAEGLRRLLDSVLRKEQ